MKLNNRPFKRALVVLILVALISAFAVCLRNGVFSGENSPLVSASDKESATHSIETSSKIVETSKTTTETELSSASETTTVSLTEATKNTTSTTKVKKTTTETTSAATEAPTESSSSRKSITDLFTTFSRTTTTNTPTNADGSIDFSCFDNCAFVGNSRLLAVGNYGFADNVYAKVGLNVNTVFTQSCEGSSIPVIDELKGKSFDKVFLMFGDNECGWGSMNAFSKQYAKVISAVKERVPNAKIYLISVLPISKATSNKNDFGCNKDSINNINKYIKELADAQGATYIDAASSIANSDGYLPDDASTDGCHLGKKYTKIWLEYTAKNM
jgi:hypothetical protein